MGRKHARLLKYTRESSTVVVLRSTNQNPWRPYPQAASQTEATRRPKAPQEAMSICLPRPGPKGSKCGPDPQRTTIQGPIVYSYSSKLQTDDVTLKSLTVTSPSQLPGLEVTPYQIEQTPTNNWADFIRFRDERET